MEVVVLKLVSGEELIARVVDGLYNKPRVIQMVPTEHGMGATLVPWILSEPDASLSIEDQFIMTKLSASSEVESSYLKATSSLQLVR